MNTQSSLFEPCQPPEENGQKAAQTFDEISDLYDKDPIAFVENLLRGRRYEFPVSGECCACASWDKITGTTPRHVTRKNHDRDGQIPRPHRFEPDTGWFLVQHLSEPRLQKLIGKYRRKGERGNEAAEAHADLLDCYRRLRFQRVN